MNILELARPNIVKMAPYSSARDEYKMGSENSQPVFLDANENPFNSGLNRYPDPKALGVKALLSELKGIPSQQIMLGNGSDEVIDLLVRVFCEPRLDNIILLPPTYGMYEVSAETNDVEVRKVPLNADFQLDLVGIKSRIDVHTKIIFVCSPNNPTGNDIDAGSILDLLTHFEGLVVVDEAYIDFAGRASFIDLIKTHPKLVVMQTFSKAWGLAAVRLGMCFGHSDLISLLNKAKPPYNINSLTQKAALLALQKPEKMKQECLAILEQRTWLEQELMKIDRILYIYPSAANFLLVRVTNANGVYQYLVNQGIVVRNRTNVVLCEECLRITVGRDLENKKLIKVLRNF
jgi:histidinol-phosphate aminotransferase